MDYTITRVTEEPRIIDGQPSADYNVEFKVGMDGPFYERFPKAEFSPSAVELRLAAFARDLKQIRGAV